jgi:hypothetical protein
MGGRTTGAAAGFRFQGRGGIRRCSLSGAAAGERGLHNWFPAARRGSREQPRDQAHRFERAERLAAR